MKFGSQEIETQCNICEHDSLIFKEIYANIRVFQKIHFLDSSHTAQWIKTSPRKPKGRGSTAGCAFGNLRHSNLRACGVFEFWSLGLNSLGGPMKSEV